MIWIRDCHRKGAGKTCIDFFRHLQRYFDILDITPPYNSGREQNAEKNGCCKVKQIIPGENRNATQKERNGDVNFSCDAKTNVPPH